MSVQYPNFLLLETLVKVNWFAIYTASPGQDPVPVLVKALQNKATEVGNWMLSYDTVNSPAGFAAFKKDWKLLRLVLPLQVRLFVEQVAYNMGKPWSQICTGFSSL